MLDVLANGLAEFRTEMYSFRSEMYDFRTEMYDFRDSMREFRTETSVKFNRLECRIDTHATRIGDLDERMAAVEEPRA